MVATRQQHIALPKEAKETSRPISFWLPEAYKAADINPKQGLITAYLTVYNDPATGQPFVDPYLDIVVPGSFSKTINDLNSARSRKNNPYLCADLWQHDRRELIGGIRHLGEDSKGVIYEAQLLMSVQRARECFDLAEAKMIGSSYGYDPIRFEHKGDIRHLLEIRLHEVSQVSFPANDLAPILDTKDAKKNFYVPDLPKFPEVIDENFSDDEEVLQAVCGATLLPIGPANEQWDVAQARQQYLAWGADEQGRPIPSRYKQLHLLIDGDTKLLTSYQHPYCYIINNSPRICVNGVKSAVSALRRMDKNDLVTGMLEKCETLYTRIATTYPDMKLLSPMTGVYKARDFATVWASKQPNELMKEFFQMSDSLSMALLENIHDKDLDDKDNSIDTSTSQFAGALKSWYPGYLEAMSELEQQNQGGDMVDMMYGMMSAEMGSQSLKRAVDMLDIKVGQSISAANRQRIRHVIESISLYLSDLRVFIGDEDDDTPKGLVPSSDYIDITQGLTVLGTLAPGQSTPPAPPTPAPISFPTLPETGEFNITDVLASIRQSMNGGT